MLDPTEARRRLVRAWAASAATGLAIYVLVLRVALPVLQARLTPAQIEWLRQAFARHPVIVLGTLVGIVAVLGLPVLGAFRWAYGPLSTRRASKARG